MMIKIGKKAIDYAFETCHIQLIALLVSRY